MENNLSVEEAEQYDRQIRLWGLEAQKRLRGACVLMIGLGGVATEVCKNIVLVGVNSLTIMDSTVLSSEDSANRFLCTKEGVSRAESALGRLQALNPNVTVKVDARNVDEITEEDCHYFDLICATCCQLKQLVRLNELCRQNNVKFFCGDTWGYYGYFFTDLQEHSYAIDVPQQDGEAIDVDKMQGRRGKLEEDVDFITEKRTISFCSLRDALSIDWTKKSTKYFRRTPPTYFIIQILQTFRDNTHHDPSVTSLEEDQHYLIKLREEIMNEANLSVDLVKEEFINHCFSELSPVCAIVGGVLSQEIVKAISSKDAPFQNMFLYDGVQSTGIVETLRP